MTGVDHCTEHKRHSTLLDGFQNSVHSITTSTCFLSCASAVQKCHSTAPSFDWCHPVLPLSFIPSCCGSTDNEMSQGCACRAHHEKASYAGHAWVSQPPSGYARQRFDGTSAMRVCSECVKASDGGFMRLGALWQHAHKRKRHRYTAIVSTSCIGIPSQPRRAPLPSE